MPPPPAGLNRAGTVLLAAAAASGAESAPTSGALAMLPLLAAFGALGWAITLLLARMTGPIAGGMKLIYAGAVAGIISRVRAERLEARRVRG